MNCPMHELISLVNLRLLDRFCHRRHRNNSTVVNFRGSLGACAIDSPEVPGQVSLRQPVTCSFQEMRDLSPEAKTAEQAHRQRLVTEADSDLDIATKKLATELQDPNNNDREAIASAMPLLGMTMNVSDRVKFLSTLGSASPEVRAAVLAELDRILAFELSTVGGRRGI